MLVPNAQMKQGMCFMIMSKPGEPVLNCGKPTGYKMVREPEQALYRKYNPFCPEHQKWVDEHPDD